MQSLSVTAILDPRARVQDCPRADRSQARPVRRRDVPGRRWPAVGIAPASRDLIGIRPVRKLFRSFGPNGEMQLSAAGQSPGGTPWPAPAGACSKSACAPP